jgi:hypothetical protein
VKLVNTLGIGWRLPTKQELYTLYGQKAVVGGFASGSYWSSSEEADSKGAWSQNFDDGNQHFVNKSFSRRVRAVRAF